MPDVVGRQFSAVELHASVLRRNPNRQYSPEEMEASNLWFRIYLDTRESAPDRAKFAAGILKRDYDAKVEMLGCVADGDGRIQHANISIAERLGRLIHR